MNYFDGCYTMFEAKARFRELAKKHHPDAGGDAKTFAEISDQMDRFHPTRSEHSNSYYGNPSYGSASSAKQDFDNRGAAWSKAYAGFQKGYRFNQTIPFDHPIHEEKRKLENELREAQKNALYFGEQLDGYRAALYYEKQLVRDRDEEIASLKSQIEVLTRPKPEETLLDKIRSYFEKPS